MGERVNLPRRVAYRNCARRARADIGAIIVAMRNPISWRRSVFVAGAVAARLLPGLEGGDRS